MDDVIQMNHFTSEDIKTSFKEKIARFSKKELANRSKISKLIQIALISIIFIISFYDLRKLIIEISLLSNNIKEHMNMIKDLNNKSNQEASMIITLNERRNKGIMMLSIYEHSLDTILINKQEQQSEIDTLTKEISTLINKRDELSEMNLRNDKSKGIVIPILP